ncbi:MAG: FMN-binding protein [Firmicutes bacterium]|nr:FMN-binding protein [Bacillota bacterium]
MLFTLSLVAALLLALLLAKPIKNCPGAFYAVSAVLSLAFALFDFTNAPHFLSAWLLDPFRRGTLGTALFVVVMFTGALEKGSGLRQKLLPIRGFLSIIATILVLCHCVYFGKTYLVRLFTGGAIGGRLSGLQTWAMIFSILMILILLPLGIASFQKIRRRMGAQKWKKLQRWAYLFYGLIYVHIVLLLLPHALTGQAGYALSVAVYSIVFALYLYLRLRRSEKLSRPVKGGCSLAGAAIALAVTLFAVLGCVDAARENNAPLASAAGGEAVLHDGTFTGVGTGYGGPVEVSIVVENGVITEIILGDNVEDPPYLKDAVKLFDDVIEQQTYKVDSVTGATSSSVGLKSAIKKAMEAAAAEQ